jgi:hypothetical protein
MMTIPGFTAEQSLIALTSQYRLGRRRATDLLSRVWPMQGQYECDGEDCPYDWGGPGGDGGNDGEGTTNGSSYDGGISCCWDCGQAEPGCQVQSGNPPFVVCRDANGNVTSVTDCSEICPCR